MECLDIFKAWNVLGRETKEMQVLGISSPCHLMLKWELAPQEVG